MTTEEHIGKAVGVLNDGGIVIYPTDTAFGIGCRIDNTEAVEKLFRIRRRPLTQATPVLVASIDQALSYYDSPKDIVRRLMRRYWPGALTIITKCKIQLFHSPIRGDGKTIGLREPDHKTAISLIRGVGVPILGPSANFHGSPTPYSLEALDPEFIKLVDYVVPGVGKAGNVSTVVDTTTTPATIIRAGAVSLSRNDLV